MTVVTEAPFLIQPCRLDRVCGWVCAWVGFWAYRWCGGALPVEQEVCTRTLHDEGPDIISTLGVVLGVRSVAVRELLALPAAAEDLLVTVLWARSTTHFDSHRGDTRA